MTGWRVGLLAAALGLGGCSGIDLPFGSDPAPSKPAPTAKVKTIATGSSQPLPPASMLTEDQSDDQSETDIASLPPIEVNDDPDQFLNRDGLAVNNSLGAPGFIRRDGPAEVWQYTGRRDGADCILDIYLYSDASAAGDFRVTYVELRGTSTTQAQRRACFADMLRRHIRANAG